MRISDWSSDVCSSDLVAAPEIALRHLLSKRRRLLVAVARRKDSAQAERKLDKAGAVQPVARADAPQIGRARQLLGNCDRTGPGFAAGHDVAGVQPSPCRPTEALPTRLHRSKPRAHLQPNGDSGYYVGVADYTPTSRPQATS